MTVAALYVDPKGCYAGLEGVEMWDEVRDARKYPGPWPGVYHPPCSRWCQLAPVVEARYGYKVGDDDGCFAAALASVRRWGGVLEHPAFSRAWPVYELHRPTTGGGWERSLWDRGWTCYVEQHAYGHPARKATWLYYVGDDPPELRWSSTSRSGYDWEQKRPKAWVSWMSNHGNPDGVVRVGKKAAAATPPDFRDALLAMARSARSAA